MKPILTFVLIILTLTSVNAQKKLTPPKVATKIESVDKFVSSAFNIYDTVYNYHHGITDQVELSDSDINSDSEDSSEENLGIEEEEEKDEFKILENNINQLIDSAPDIIEEIDKHSVAKKLKATLSLNKAMKALKYSGKIVKAQFTGAEN